MGPRVRPVVYIVIDGMSSEAFEQVVASGRAPALAFLKERSRYVRDSVAVFPTITPAASASLVTGATPAEHRIPGMCWYDRDAQRFVNYGQSPRAAIVEGVSQIVEDVLVNLNCKHLDPRVPTIHDLLHQLGFTTASINFMVFRGPFKHRPQPNPIARLLFDEQIPAELPGPKEHYFADVIDGASGACSGMLSARSPRKRVRVTDEWAACVTRDLLEHEAAELILFYLHENDHHSHRQGPSGQIDSLASADQHIAHVLDTFGSWEQTFDRLGFVVTADHSQSPIGSSKDHALSLNEILEEFDRVEPDKGSEPLEGRDLAATGNGRAAFVYLNGSRRDELCDVVLKRLVECPGVDQVIWRDGGGYRVRSDRGELWFTRDPSGIVDDRGHRWKVQGDLEVVNGVTEDGRLRTSEYPLALWRIACALDLDRVGDIVVTSKLTYAFKDLAGADHRGGGDHASLHVQDSIVPFMSTLDSPPRDPSTVDVVPHLVEHFRRVA